MNKVERVKLVKAMELIARNVNDEDVFETWLREGVADGDIPYGSLSVEVNDFENLEYYLDDDSFTDLMDTFLYLMRAAGVSGGLYCDKVACHEIKEDDDDE